MKFQACAYCEHPNPLGTNYCNDCGAALHVKPCRQCGAVAVAKASHCPVCRTEFPVRPTIDVDIPWAVTTRPAVGGRPADAEADNGEAAFSPHSATERLAAATEALTQTRNLIEKASLKALPQSEQSAPRPRRPAPQAGPRHVPATPGLVANDVVQLPVSRGNRLWKEADDDEHATLGRAAPSARPVVVVTLLGLVASVALVFLIRYASEDPITVNHQVTSPYKLLRSAGTTPSVEPVIAVPAAPPAPLAPADAATVVRPADAASIAPAGGPAASTAADSAPAISNPAASIPAASIPAASIPAASVPAASRPSAELPAVSVPPVPPAPAPPAPPAPLALPELLELSELPVPRAASESSEVPATPGSASDSQTAVSTPMASPPPPLPQPATSHPPESATSAASPGGAASGASPDPSPDPSPGGCRPELRALNLCGKVGQSL